jgi:hypothetical protein
LQLLYSLFVWFSRNKDNTLHFSLSDERLANASLDAACCLEVFVPLYSYYGICVVVLGVRREGSGMCFLGVASTPGHRARLLIYCMLSKYITFLNIGMASREIARRMSSLWAALLFEICCAFSRANYSVTSHKGISGESRIITGTQRHEKRVCRASLILHSI